MFTSSPPSVSLARHPGGVSLSDTDGDIREDAEFMQQNKGPKYKDQLKKMTVKNRTWNLEKQMPSNNLIITSRSRTASILTPLQNIIKRFLHSEI